MNTQERQHNYGIDLLRIAAMLMIVAHHFSVHSGISVESGNDVVMRIMALGGKTGVNIFVLITGFYSTGKLRREKLLGLICSTTFYSVALTLLSVVLGSAAVSKKLLLKAALPWLLGGNYWFVITYLELCLLTPILNQVARELDTRTFEKYLGLFTLLFCLVPQVLGRVIEVNDYGYNALVWFVYLYFLGAYLRRRTWGGRAWQYICSAVVMMLLQIAACAAVDAGIESVVLECVSDYSANAVFPLATAVVMLLGFWKLQIPCGRKLLQTVGAATLGIYLFHDNVNFRGWLWQNVYRLAAGVTTLPFAVNGAAAVLAVFAMGFAVEYLRSRAAEKLLGFIRRNQNETSLHHRPDQ